MTAASGDAQAGTSARPLVSVIMPCYNVERWVAEAIDSALNQTYQPMEIIAVDDGSSDSTLSILQSYGTAIQTISQANTGISGARYAALKIAAGDYVAFLDADDVWRPDKTEQQMQFLLANPAYGLIGSGCSQIDEHSQRLGTCPVICEEAPWLSQEPPIQDASDLELHLPGNCVGSPSGMIASKALLDEIDAFSNSLPFGAEDWDFLLRVVNRTSIASYSDELFGYRFSGEGVSSPKNAEKMLRAELGIAEEFVLREQERLPPNLLDRIKAYRYLGAARAYLSNGESQRCRGAAMQAIRHAPSMLLDKRTIYLLGASCIGVERVQRWRGAKA